MYSAIRKTDFDILDEGMCAGRGKRVMIGDGIRKQ